MSIIVVSTISEASRCTSAALAGEKEMQVLEINGRAYSPKCDKGRGLSHWLHARSISLAFLIRAIVLPEHMQHYQDLTLLRRATSDAPSLGFP